MIFTVTFKTPDCVQDSVTEVAIQETFNIENTDDREDKQNEIIRELKKFTEKWVRYGEYIIVEFDTEKGTCKVLGG